MITFEKPVGAHADCKELEYISALHQSGPTLRQDASITAQDVVNFLLSRHGIKVDLTYVENNIMPGLAGDIDESPDAVFDLVELASILLIPHLRKTGAGDDSEFLFDRVLKMITLDVTGSSEPVRLDRTLMLNIAKTYGEEDVTSAVVDEMLKAAGVQKDGSPMFDYKKLVNATTADIQQYDPEWETRETTYYDDVLDRTSLDANLEDNDPDEELAKANFDDAPDKIRRIFTLTTIDTVAENYKSKTFNVLLWVLVVVVLYQYASGFVMSVGLQDCPTTSFMSELGCRVANSIIRWLTIMVQLITLGTIFVMMSTAGNSVHLKHNLPSFVGVMLGIVTIMFTSLLSYIFDVEFSIINTNKSSSVTGQFGYSFALALGCFLLLFQIKGLLYVLIPRSRWKNVPFANFWLTCEMAKSECCTKQAAAYKIKRMVDHAFAQHDGSILRKAESARVKLKASSFKSASAKAMMIFQATADHRERVGGIFYTFRRMWNGSLFKEDGVFIHAGLYAMNMSQWFVAILYIILYTSLDPLVQSAYHPATNAPSVAPSPTTIAFAFPHPSLPTEAEVRCAVGVGCVTAFLAAASLAVVLIPSSVSTIQQFRCGYIGSLRCRNFPLYREAPDVTTILLGSTFWGTLFSCLSILIIVATLTFFLVWSATRSLVIILLANIIAILLTLAVKILLLTFVRQFIFVGFFRKSPIGGNVLMLILGTCLHANETHLLMQPSHFAKECWSLGLTVGTMVVRMFKLFLISALYIGRLDTPLFAPGVGMIGPISVDGHPVQFRKGLILHDAHRHPYMERLGVIYLLKLKYGEHFANRAGGQWRLIFVMALMPWLRKYRVDDSITKYATNEAFRDEQPSVVRADAGMWVPTDASIGALRNIEYYF
ncbi:hypothetical protein MHU86_23627 [Fragilaria crotonensis]|nr:hypothetical protein MHU86_23627 [Fragilaria crotonensis]